LMDARYDHRPPIRPRLHRLTHPTYVANESGRMEQSLEPILPRKRRQRSVTSSSSSSAPRRPVATIPRSGRPSRGPGKGGGRGSGRSGGAS
jgi:hypothetical protein